LICCIKNNESAHKQLFLKSFRFSLVIILCFDSRNSKAQLVIEKYDAGVAGYVSSAVFSDRYGVPLYDNIFQVKDTAIFIRNKVRRLEARDAAQNLKWAAEFDTINNTTKTGVQGFYYFIEDSTYYNSEKERVKITKFWKGNTLERIGTTRFQTLSYKSADTLINYTKETNIVQKTGALINEQNHYYNSLGKYGKLRFKNLKYAKKPGKYILGIIFRKNRYRHKKFKTNYDTAALFTSSVSNYNYGFYWMKNGTKNYVEESKLSVRHFKKGNKILTQKYFTSGESYNQPSNSSYTRLCGYASASHYDEIENTSYSFLYNSQKLPIEYVSKYKGSKTFLVYSFQYIYYP